MPNSSRHLSRRLVPLLFLATCGAAQEQDEDRVVVQETYSIPVAENPRQPLYPSSEASRGGEGIVQLNFMVSETGEVLDPTVTHATGSPAFRRAALKAIRQTEFTPAMLNGEPIVGSSVHVYRFNMQGGSKGAGRRFVSIYNDFNKAIESGNREEQEAALRTLEASDIHNHYENAYLNFARYRFAQLHGSEFDQMIHMHAALAWPHSVGDIMYFSEDMVLEMRRALFTLQARNNYFREALDTFDLMKAAGDTEGVSQFSGAVEAIWALQHNDADYSMLVRLGDSGSDFVRLFKNSFEFAGGQGEIDEVKLRCSKKFAAFPVERGLAYDLPESWGSCSMEVLGDAGTEVSLVQY